MNFALGGTASSRMGEWSYIANGGTQTVTTSREKKVWYTVGIELVYCQSAAILARALDHHITIILYLVIALQEQLLDMIVLYFD